MTRNNPNMYKVSTQRTICTKHKYTCADGLAQDYGISSAFSTGDTAVLRKAINMIGNTRIWPRSMNDLEFHTMKPEQNGRHFANILKYNFFKEYCILIKFLFSLKFVPKGKWGSIGSGNGLVINTQQAITWMNHCWPSSMVALLSINELIIMMCCCNSMTASSTTLLEIHHIPVIYVWRNHETARFSTQWASFA